MSISKEKTNKRNYNKNQQRHWKWEYCENIKLIARGNYIIDKANGLWEWYYSDGKVVSKGNYINGKANEWWEFYNRKGKLKDMIFYVNI